MSTRSPSVHQSGGDDSDGACEAEGLSDDGVCMGRHVVPAAGGDLTEVGDDRFLLFDADDLTVNQIGRFRGTAGRIDPEEHAERPAVPARVTKRSHDGSSPAH
ncbi:MAG: hypothetical protein JRI98_09900, partial [Deltaproteobacteria bacterium]|nr:hypothetical protein [Deltaproteobacteria bacterium]